MSTQWARRTSQGAALLQVVHALAVVAFAQLFPHKPAHHDLHPLLPDDGILRLLQPLGVIVVDAVERGRHGGLLRQEGGGLGGRHFVGVGPRRDASTDASSVFSQSRRTPKCSSWVGGWEPLLTGVAACRLTMVVCREVRAPVMRGTADELSREWVPEI